MSCRVLRASLSLTRIGTHFLDPAGPSTYASNSTRNRPPVFLSGYTMCSPSGATLPWHWVWPVVFSTS